MKQRRLLLCLLLLASILLAACGADKPQPAQKPPAPAPKEEKQEQQSEALVTLQVALAWRDGKLYADVTAQAPKDKCANHVGHLLMDSQLNPADEPVEYFAGQPIKLTSRVQGLGPVDLDAEGKGTASIEIPEAYAKLPTLCFQMVTTVSRESLTETQRSSDTTVNVPPKPAAQPTAEPPGTPPPVASEVDPDEFCWPCFFDQAVTQPAGYAYARDLQLLDQHHRAAWGTHWCAPTGMGISLGWLAEQGYPGLVPDTNGNGKIDDEDKYELIDRLGELMKTDPNKGTTGSNILEGLRRWLQQVGLLNRFVIKRIANPTFEDYRRELLAGEDVLLGLLWPGGGHIVTGRSLATWPDPDGTYRIDFVDPGTGRIYWTRMKPNGDVWYGGQWVTTGMLISVSPVEPPPVPATCFLGFNPADPPVADVELRRALILSLDRAELVARFGDAGWEPATCLVPPALWPEGMSPCDDLDVRYDPEAALGHLNRARHDLPITLVTHPDAQEMAEWIVQRWQSELGVDASVEVMEWEAFVEHVESDPPGLYLIGWLADYPSPLNFIEMPEIREAEIPGMAELLAEVRETPDEAGRYQLFAEAERLLCVDQAAIAPLYYYTR